jgi:formiminoglutamate deiminase
VSRSAAGDELWAARAWLGAEKGFSSGVLISCDPSGDITEVRSGVDRSECAGGAVIGGDVCLPGFVNAHSHAFHRALRGVSETVAGSFWTWRDLMYNVASRLDPDSYRELAALVYAEMLLSGYTAVGEFHYLHHGAGGTAYSDPNAMGAALLEAAETVGIRMTLLDTCYLQAGVNGAPLEGAQLRFGDGSADGWAERVSTLLARAPGGAVRVGVAAHSVRAVPRSGLEAVAALADSHAVPLHVHLSEQRRENEECLEVLGFTPTGLLCESGALSARTTAVHATHLAGHDLTLLGEAACGVCACPTTERDLGDGVGPFSELARAGAVLSIGSDSHAVIDALEETRALELNERLASERRGIWKVADLLGVGTSGGARALGWPEGGISAGSPADVVGVRVGSIRTAGGGGDDGPQGRDEELLARILFAGSPADVDSVVVGGRLVVSGGEHVSLGPPEAVAQRLEAAVGLALGASR